MLPGPPLSGFVMWSPFCTTWFFDAVICSANGQKKGPESKRDITQTRPSSMSAGDNEDVGIWRTDLSAGATQTTCNLTSFSQSELVTELYKLLAVNNQHNHQNECWQRTFLQNTLTCWDFTFLLDSTLFNFMLWQCCAYDLVRFRDKKTLGYS